MDSETVLSCRLLRRTVSEGVKPIILWLGAGASAWNGFPKWADLARDLRREFFHLRGSAFNNAQALRLIEHDLPGFFQMCRGLDSELYFRFLTKTLSARPTTVLYQRLVTQLQKIPPLHILTTNVDESLEQSLGPIRVAQNTDLSLCTELLHSSESFIGKLHGTVSSVTTMVFTTQDYELLLSDQAYLGSVRSILYEASVIFLGYSLRDQYLIDLLQRTAAEKALFGSGPYFLATSDLSFSIPNVHRISYRNERHKDHRGTLSALDVVYQSMDLQKARNMLSFREGVSGGDTAETKETAYYISDFKPPGTWHTEETVEFASPGGAVGNLTSGLGFSNDELHISGSDAMHDFTVGLICFDHVYLQLISLSALYSVLKEDLFKEVIEADAIRFIHMVNVLAVIYDKGATFGELMIVRLGGSAQKEVPVPPGELIPEISVREMLERQVRPAPGKEKEGLLLIDKIENLCRVFKYEVGDGIGFELGDALLMPDVTKLLGISDAILPTQVPLWLKFPYLRMADLVHTGRICSQLGIQAAKVPYGGGRLISAAFGIQPASEWAEQVASYSMSARFDSNLGAYVTQQPQVIRQILRFRKSAEGEQFRREVAEALLRETGAEFTASVNAGLRRNIPMTVLQKGHDRLLSLMTESAKITPVPAVWTSLIRSDESTIAWRRKSFVALSELCKTRGIKKDDPCICGSGDKLRLCCMHPLNS